MGKNLSTLVKQTRLTNAQLAKKLKVSRTTIWRWRTKIKNEVGHKLWLELERLGKKK